MKPTYTPVLTYTAEYQGHTFSVTLEHRTIDDIERVTLTIDDKPVEQRLIDPDEDGTEAGIFAFHDMRDTLIAVFSALQTKETHK